MNYQRVCLAVEDLHVIYKNSRLFRKAKRQHVLKGLNFAVRRGESIGIVGRNGAGKSTLLRVLAGIIEPDQGKAINYGVNVSLLSLGSGAVPDCTGLDNAIMLAMLQLNASRAEAEALLPAILEFAQLGTSIGEPVKFYSAGMRLRLQFAVAVQTQCDVLLVDEVLAVGDLGFQEKSRKAMEAKIRSEQTVVLVSHNLHALRTLCDRVIWIENGEMKADGPADEVIGEYQAFWNPRSRSESSTKEGRSGWLEPVPKRLLS